MPLLPWGVGGAWHSSLSSGWRAVGGLLAEDSTPQPRRLPLPHPQPRTPRSPSCGGWGGHMERVCLEHREPSFSKFKAQKCKPPLQRLS